MRVGFFTHVKGDGDVRRTYRDTIELAVTAERSGLDSFWVAQHHGGAAGSSMPAPFVLLAAIAERTNRIELGVAAIVSPAEHPRRLAEDAAVLDQLSGGRLRLALGAGSDLATAAAFGYDHDQRHQRTLAVLDEVLTMLHGTAPHRLCPPAPDLAARVLLASGTAEGARAAAARRVGIISGRRGSGATGPVAGDAELARHLAAYRRVWAAGDRAARREVSADGVVGDGAARGGAPRRWAAADGVVEAQGAADGGHARAGGPRAGGADTAGERAAGTVVVSRPVVCAADRATARAVLLADADRWLAAGRAAGRWDASYHGDAHLAAGNAYLGTADEVAAQLRSDPGVALADELICHTQPASPPAVLLGPVLQALGRDLRPRLASLVARP